MTDDDTIFLTQKEVCKLLRWSRSTLYRRRQDDNTFPSALLFGHELRWKKSDVMAWAENQTEDEPCSTCGSADWMGVCPECGDAE